MGSGPTVTASIHTYGEFLSHPSLDFLLTLSPSFTKILFVQVPQSVPGMGQVGGHMSGMGMGGGGGGGGMGGMPAQSIPQLPQKKYLAKQVTNSTPLASN